MLSTASTWFYIILLGIAIYLVMNEEKLLKKESEHERRKAERSVKDESLSQER